MMYHCMPIDLRSPLTAKPFENVRHTHLHQLIHHREKHSKKRHRGDHHQVVAITSSRLGQVTCFISTRTSRRNSRVLATVPVTLLPNSEPIPPCDSSLPV